MLSLRCPWRTASLSPLLKPQTKNQKREAFFSTIHRRRDRSLTNNTVTCAFVPVDPWSPTTTIDSQSIASQLFAVSLFPYLGFLYFITKSKTAPKLTLFGFYFLLAFVGATTKLHYGTSLSNVDWLHGGAESLLTLTNIFIVLGLREALRKLKDDSTKNTSDQIASDAKENSLSR